jgi:hypothetical protein
MNEEAAEQIVDRLKAEGDLIRNSGTNSIRSVKIQLDRFEDIFNVISENLITQTAMLAKSLDIQSGELELAKETTRREETAKQFEDLEAKQDQVELKKPEDKKGSDGPGIFGTLKEMGIGKLLLGGASIFLASNLARGFLEGSLGDLGFDREAAASFAEAAGLAGLWGAIGLVFGRRMGLVGAAAGAAGSFADEILDMIGVDADEQVRIFGAEFSAGAGATGVLAAIGATVALIAPSLLGLTGSLIVGALTGPVGLAALGGAALIGTVMLIERWMERRRTEFLQELEDATAEGLANVRNIQTGDDPGIARRLLLGLGIAESQTPGEELAAVIQQIERTGRISDSDVIVGMGETGPRTLTDEQSRSVETILRNVLNIPEGIDTSSFDFSQIDLSNLSDRQLNDIRRASEMIGLDSLITRLDEATAIVERTAEIQNRINALSGERQAMEEASSMSSIPLSESQITRIDEIGREIFELHQTLKEVRGYSSGTKGFQDFGDGSFAILHGREAVIPEDTPAGRFLQQYFDENWSPKISPISAAADRVATAADGAVAMIVVNNTPVVNAPVTNVRGGPSIHNSTYFGGGGGSPMNPYGLTSAIS